MAKGKQNYLDQIRYLIGQQRYINITVDGYYWIPNSFNWQTNHFAHKSLISGYDDEKQILYVFEDDFNGYNEFEVPYKRLHTAITSNDTYEYFEYVLPKTVPQFKLCLDELVESAKIIVHSISALSFQDFYYACCNINQTYFASWLKRTESRYQSNVALFELLKKKHMLPTSYTDVLIDSAKKLLSDWSKFKTLFMIALRKNKLDFQVINQHGYKCFAAERALWLQFIADAKTPFLGSNQPIASSP